MKFLTLILSFVLMSNSFGQSAEYKKMLSKYYNDFPTISIENALTHVKKGDALFLDVRKKDEFLVSHIKSAKRMNLDGSNISDLKNVAKNKLIITYCHTHQRSAHSYIVLKSLGYPNVKGYHGAWSDWGNDPNTLIE